MTAARASRLVNSVENDGPDLLRAESLAAAEAVGFRAA